MPLSKGTLYVCGTPIGNLEDITLRALRVLKGVKIIAAEDTRHTRKLLSHYGISAQLISYHEHNKGFRGDELIGRLIGGEDIALVSDAGMPGISDPGYELIRDAVQAEIKVEAVPGPSASITALVVSGFPASRFIFDSFLPRRVKERREYLAEISKERRTIVLYEAPHRLLGTLADIRDVLGKRRLAVARELTKKHEDVIRGDAAELLEYFEVNKPKGEIVIVISGYEGDEREEIPMTEEQIVDRVGTLLDQGIDKKSAIKQVAQEANIPRKMVYSLMIKKTPYSEE